MNEILTRRILSTAVVSILCMQFVGCYTFRDGERIRVGEISVDEPPPQMDEPERIHPVDSYRTAAFHFSARPLWQFGRLPHEGFRIPNRHGGAQINVAATPQLFYSPRQTIELVPVLLPLWGIGGGCAPCTTGHPGGRRWFVEVDASLIALLRLGAGWSFQPATGQHGPQITLGAEFFHVRWVKHGDTDWAVLYDLSIPVVYLLGFFDY